MGGDEGGKPTSTGRREDEAVPVPGAPARGFDLVTHWSGQRPRGGSVQVPHLWRDRVEEALSSRPTRGGMPASSAPDANTGDRLQATGELRIEELSGELSSRRLALRP